MNEDINNNLKMDTDLKSDKLDNLFNHFKVNLEQFNIQKEHFFNYLHNGLMNSDPEIIEHFTIWLDIYYKDNIYNFTDVEYIDGATEYSSYNAKKHLIDSIKKYEILQINDNISDEQLQNILKDEIINKLNTYLMHFSQQWKIWFYKDKAELPCSELKYVDTCRGHLEGKFWESCRDYYTICDTTKKIPDVRDPIGCSMVGCEDGDIVRCGEHYNLWYRLGGCIGCSSLRCNWSQAWHLAGCNKRSPEKCSITPAWGKDNKGCDLSCKLAGCEVMDSEERCINNDACQWCNGRCMDSKLECIPWCDHKNPNCDSCYVNDCNFLQFGHTCENHYKAVGDDKALYCSSGIHWAGIVPYPSCLDPSGGGTCRIPPNVTPNIMQKTLSDEQINKIKKMVSKYDNLKLTESDKEEIEDIFKNSNDFDNAILEIEQLFINLNKT